MLPELEQKAAKRRYTLGGRKYFQHLRSDVPVHPGLFLSGCDSRNALSQSIMIDSSAFGGEENDRTVDAAVMRDQTQISPACTATLAAVANYACKKFGGIRRERSLGTCDKKIAERQMKEWLGNFYKVDVEVEKTTLHQLIGRYLVVTSSMSESSRITVRSIIKKFLIWWLYGRDYQIRQFRPSTPSRRRRCPANRSTVQFVAS